MPKFLFASTSVGSIGSGFGGGAELTLLNIASELRRRGYEIDVVAPAGSHLEGIPIAQIPGNVQIPAQIQARDTPITMPANSVLANMWEYARSHQHHYDLILNFAYDWLPIYLTPFFQSPVAHLIGMSSISQFMDEAVVQLAQQFPQQIAFHTQTQAATFGLTNMRCLSNGIDLTAYTFCPTPQKQLAWVARLAPEKGLEDAIAAAQQANLPLKIMGMMQDEEYWQQICEHYPNAQMEYLGFLPRAELQVALGSCAGMLMTHQWIEAFGNVVIEALACGVPTIAYQRGGPAEIVRDGQTGFLVEPDNIPGLVSAIVRLGEIDGHACRQQAEQEFSLTALGDRCEQWIQAILTQS